LKTPENGKLCKVKLVCSMSWYHTSISPSLATWNSYTTHFICLRRPTKEHWNYLAGLQHRALPIRHITSAVYSNSADLRYLPIRCPISISRLYHNTEKYEAVIIQVPRPSVYRACIDPVVFVWLLCARRTEAAAEAVPLVWGRRWAAQSFRQWKTPSWRVTQAVTLPTRRFLPSARSDTPPGALASWHKITIVTWLRKNRNTTTWETVNLKKQ